MFVVSLPRSWSGLVPFVAQRVLGLREPRWTSDGELLNVDRLAHFRGPREGSTAAYTSPDDDPDLFGRLVDFLDQAVQPTGFVYKDVIQPFVMAAWLPQTNLRVVRIVRPVADVAYAMLARGWHYPCAATSSGRDGDASLVEGLLRAQEALATIRAATVAYDDLVTDEQALTRTFAAAYPEVEIGTVRYAEERFAHERLRQLARRATPRYKALAVLVEELRHDRPLISAAVSAEDRSGAWSVRFPVMPAGRAIALVDDLDVNEVKDGLVVYDPGNDRVHYLNATAAVVFTLCDGSRDAEAIADIVGRVFGGDGPGRNEVFACIAKFEGEGLLRSDG